jgi:hypothetical protein
MKRMIENLTGNYSASASVVDGTLIISLPDAISPVVWRLELGQAKASALEVKASEGVYTLQLKTPRGTSNDIASFAVRGRAVAALMAVSRAMEKSHGQVYPAANDTEPYNPALLPVPTRKRKKQQQPGGKNRLGAIIAAIIIIIILGNIFLTMGPKRVKMASNSGTVTSEATKDTAGVPVSADDFLKSH